VPESTYEIAPTDTVVLNVLAMEADAPGAPALSLATLASYVNLDGLPANPHFHIIFKLVFDPSTGKFQVGLPGVFAKDPARLMKGQAYKLC
jgi:hypothetical protein